MPYRGHTAGDTLVYATVMRINLFVVTTEFRSPRNLYDVRFRN